MLKENDMATNYGPGDDDTFVEEPMEVEDIYYAEYEEDQQDEED